MFASQRGLKLVTHCQDRDSYDQYVLSLDGVFLWQRVLFGLGDDSQIELVEVRWPDGSVEVWRELPVNAYSTLKAGSGEAIEKAAIP